MQVVNDRGPRAKCFAFVTFTNPRSAIDAIKDMDGRVCIFSIMEYIPVLLVDLIMVNL